MNFLRLAWRHGRKIVVAVLKAQLCTEPRKGDDHRDDGDGTPMKQA